MRNRAVFLSPVLVSLLLSSAALANSRWTGKAPTDAGLRGLERAAAARGCAVHRVLPGAVSFDCPRGVALGAGFRRATRMLPHDTTTNVLLNADDVHAPNPFGGGFDGTGVRVGVIDTGLDTDHPDLADSIDMSACVNTTGDPNGCEDIDGHGTAVAGTITGNGGDCSSGDCSIGIAPGATVFGVKVFPDNGDPIYDDDLAAAIYKALDYAPDVLNISIGGGRSRESDCDNDGDTSVDAVNYAFAQGVAVAVSAGNAKYKDGIEYPACASGALAVGATYQRDEGTVVWSGCRDRNAVTDQVTCFSNVGPALDVVAPGAFLWAAEVGGTYAWFHGTSASSPVTAGEAALLLEQNANLTPAQVYESLNNTALELGSGKNKNRNGNGRIDSYLAAQYVHENFQTCGSNEECDDGNVCTDDWCDLETASCVNAPNTDPCDDGDLCTDNDVCAGGFCSGTQKDCSDGDLCTDDFCAAGVCDNPPVDCDDSIECTVDSCNPANGFCEHDDSGCPECALVGEACTVGGDCCSGKCKGKPGRKTCK